MKLLSKINNNIRIITQIAFTALTNGYINGFLQGTIYGGESKNLCVPGLNCYSCPGALGACPMGSLQAVLSSRDYKFSFYVVGFLMAFGAFFGRFVCGWLCPFGLIQDLLYKIPFPLKVKKVYGDKYLKYLKYIVLIVFVIILPITIVNVAGGGNPWFCKWICPSGTLLGGVPLILENESLKESIGFLFSWKLSILILILLVSIMIYRPFCRYLCPLGAIYSFFNPISIYRFKIDKDKCTNCTVCQSKCKLDIPIYEDVNSLECIRCGDCIKVCPKNAITVTFSKNIKNKSIFKKNVRGNNLMKKITICIMMFAISVLVLTGCNNDNKIKSEVDNMFNAIKTQDSDKVDKYFPESGLGSFIYSDKEGFKMYSKNMSWKIENIKKKDDKVIVDLKINNTDMVSILKKNPPKLGEMMPNPTMKDIDSANKKEFTIALEVVKSGENYICKASPEFAMKLLNVITGGGTDYLAEYNKDYFKKLDGE